MSQAMALTPRAGCGFAHFDPRARRLETAMRCRGFQGHFYRLETSRWQGADSALLLALTAVLAGLLLLDRLL